MLTKIKRVWTHLVYAPTFYMMRLSLHWAPDHPWSVHPIPDIHHWAAHGTATLRVWNHLLWASIVVEAFALVAVINYYWT